LTDQRAELAATFQHPGVAKAYQHRPPYPDEVFDLLTGLITTTPRNVLDLGAGEGALARPLARRVDHVDALDISVAMIEAGKRRDGGDQPNLRWITGAAETAPLPGPYALVTAGASLHWMAPRPTLARLAGLLADQAYLVIVDHGYGHVPWEADLLEVIRRHSRSPDYNPDADLADSLVAEGLFEVVGRADTVPVPFRQSVEHYLERLHSTSSLAREHMTAGQAAEFGQQVRAAAGPHASSGILELSVVASLTWGWPVTSAA
jgi:SAM-dependent methyltransferase